MQLESIDNMMAVIAVMPLRQMQNTGELT